MRVFPTIKIVVLRKKTNKAGEWPIYLQFTLKRISTRMSLRKSVPPNTWTGCGPKYVRETGPNKHPNGRSLNIYLTHLDNKAQSIVLAYEQRGEALTWEKFEAEFYPKRVTHDFLTFHSLYVEKQKGEGIALTTLESYETRLRKLHTFAPELKIQDVDQDFIQRYAAWLRITLGNSSNTIYKDVQYVGAVCTLAAKKNVIPNNPIVDWVVRREVKVMNHLSAGELTKMVALYRSGLIPASKQNVLGQFLFCCYTGLAYGDVKELRYGHVQSDDSGALYIEKKRYKTAIDFVVPLIPEALEFIAYPGEGRVFRVISNHKTNAYLKWCAEVVGITKDIKFHTGRHTFGTRATNRGLRREVLQLMMGHAKETMTAHYAKLNISTIVAEGLEFLSDNTTSS